MEIAGSVDRRGSVWIGGSEDRGSVHRRMGGSVDQMDRWVDGSVARCISRSLDRWIAGSLDRWIV